MALSPDGRIIASASLDSKLWDVATGQERATLSGHKGGVLFVAFSRDGETVVSVGWTTEAGNTFNAVRQWNVATGKEVATVKLPEDRTNLALSSDGTLLATKQGYPCSTTKVWDVNTGKELVALQADARDVGCVSFASDGKTVATTGTDGAVKVWDLGTGREKTTLKGLEGRLEVLALSPDAKLVAAYSPVPPRRAKVWDVATGKELITLEKVTVSSLAFSPDGKLLAVGGFGELRLLDVPTGKERGSFKGHKSKIMSVAFSSDGKQVVTGSWDRTVKLWDVPAGEK